MKTRIAIFLLLLCGVALPVQAQQAAADCTPENSPAEAPRYLYCEIICNHLPRPRGTSVIFDFGQETDYWRYNMLTDSEGRDLIFNSGIQALNYMVGRGWEFVQSYSSGEKDSYVHMLLRIATSKLPEEALAEALATPGISNQEKQKKRGSDFSGGSNRDGR